MCWDQKSWEAYEARCANPPPMPFKVGDLVVAREARPAWIETSFFIKDDKEELLRYKKMAAFPLVVTKINPGNYMELAPAPGTDYSELEAMLIALGWDDPASFVLYQGRTS